MVDGDYIRWHFLVFSHAELDYDMMVVDGDYIRWNFSRAELDSGGKHMAGKGEVEEGFWWVFPSLKQYIGNWWRRGSGESSHLYNLQLHAYSLLHWILAFSCTTLLPLNFRQQVYSFFGSHFLPAKKPLRSTVRVQTGRVVLEKASVGEGFSDLMVVLGLLSSSSTDAMQLDLTLYCDQESMWIEEDI